MTHLASAETGFFIVTYGATIYGARQYLKGVEQENILKKHVEIEKKRTQNQYQRDRKSNG